MVPQDPLNCKNNQIMKKYLYNSTLPWKGKSGRIIPLQISEYLTIATIIKTTIIF
jgi:hypothetical protein